VAVAIAAATAAAIAAVLESEISSFVGVWFGFKNGLSFPTARFDIKVGLVIARKEKDQKMK
jgi:hypothetical protein